MPEVDPIQEKAESIVTKLDNKDTDLSEQAMNEMIELFRQDRDKFNSVMRKADELDGRGGWDLEVTDEDKDGNVEVAIRRNDSMFIPDIFERALDKISGDYKRVIGTDTENSGQGFEAGRRLNAAEY